MQNQRYRLRRGAFVSGNGAGIALPWDVGFELASTPLTSAVRRQCDWIVVARVQLWPSPLGVIVQDRESAANENKSRPDLPRMNKRILTGNLQRFGFEKAAKAETLQEIIEEMGDGDAEGIPTGNT